MYETQAKTRLQRLLNRSWVLICTSAFGLSLAGSAFAGSIFVSGHDADFHASLGPNASGAQNLINRALDFARDGNSAPILLLESGTANIALGDHTDSESGLTASGYSAASAPGQHYVKLNSSQFSGANLSLYSAIFVPSDHGGTLTGDDLLSLNARSSDILNYLNAGGGLVAFAEDGNRTGPAAASYGFLPFLVSAAAHSQGESGFTLTSDGAALGLTTSDINGNFSHAIFLNTGGMNVVDRDAAGQVISLDWRGDLGSTGATPEPATLALCGLGALAFLGLGRRRRTAN